MKRKNVVLAIVFVVIVLATLFVTFAVWEYGRNSQISTLKQFVTDHNYTLEIGTVEYFTNITTLDFESFEQKCTTIFSQGNFGGPKKIIDEQTSNWLIFPRDTFIIIDWKTRTVYQWIV